MVAWRVEKLEVRGYGGSVSEGEPALGEAAGKWADARVGVGLAAQARRASLRAELCRQQKPSGWPEAV